MDVKELREKSAQELDEELTRLRKEQFGLRMQRANGQLAQLHLLKEARRDIARVKTIMSEKARETVE